MYNANKHENFSHRMTNLMRQVWACNEEAARLRAIYDEETASGTDVAFVTTDDATKQELIDAIVFLSSYKALIDGSAAISQTNRTANITPFLAGG